MTLTPPQEEYLLIGRIAGSFGLRGMLKMTAVTADVDHLRRKVPTVFLGPKYQPYQVTAVAQHKPGLLLLTLAGVSDRLSADQLRGTDVWIPESQAAPLAEGEYFLHDLVGLRVQTDEGAELGTVREAFDTGANDVLVVTRPEGGEVLLPMIQDVVKSLNVPGGLIIVHLLPGLVE